MFEMINETVSETQPAVIKVIGVGGGGGNAVQYMMKRDLKGVELFCANTDLQALDASLVKNKIQIGKQLTRGLGAGANPEIGKEAAEEDKEKITNILQGTDMLFIAVGMGGGTGTGAAPIIADIARQMGILTVAVITKPFTFEGIKRGNVALDGIIELSSKVDSLITVPNDRLLAVMGKNANMTQAFDTANGVLYGAVQGISDLILQPGMINVDFADVRTVMSEKGIAMMGAGSGFGEDKAREAVDLAISSPLLENIDLSTAKGVLVNVTAGSDFGLDELTVIGDAINEITDHQTTVIVGTVIDDKVDDEVRVTIVATGISQEVEQISSSTKSALSQANKQPYDKSMKMTEQQAKRSKALETKKQEPKKSGYMDLDIPAFLRKKID